MHFPIISIFIKYYNSPNEHCVETQMLTLSKERFTKIQKEAPLEFQNYFVQVTKYQAAQHCKVISSFIVSIQTVFAHRWNQTNPAKPELKSSYLWAWKLFLLDQVAEVISLRILNLEKLSLTFWKKKKKTIFRRGLSGSGRCHVSSIGLHQEHIFTSLWCHQLSHLEGTALMAN